MMNQRTLDVLEYARLRAQIAGYCLSEEGEQALLERQPLSDRQRLRELKALCADWMTAQNGRNPPRFTAWPPVTPFLPQIPVEGARLQAASFYALGQLCESVASIRQWADEEDRRGGRETDASAVRPTLIQTVQTLPALNEVRAAIFRVIDHAGEVRDLPEIRSIRESISRIRRDIEKLVNGYLNDDSYKSMLQSTVPALRDGRQVIALKSNFRGRIKGIVHELSQSGQTVYIEPEDVVDRNNDLVGEEHRLHREIERILRELTAAIAPYHEEIVAALQQMVFLDGIGAAARWGAAYRCVLAADLEKGAVEGELRILQARHPLLGAKAVPIDLVLPSGGRMLIVTGPNTGGKTVALKTAALFALLNQSGWPVPASELTALPIFDTISCDIGDEQSLDQSLSTFSAHMKNVAGMLESATENSLVVLDELGSGTDPQEGGAIAMAVLDALLERGTLVLVTTHHGILKNYGYTHEHCINASVDFDQDTLSPTYRILMGIPGESHALDVASRNGLDPAIVAKARTYLKEERADVSALIKGLTAKHEELSRFDDQKKKEELSLREKRRKTELKELQLRQRELELREEGFKRVDNLLDKSRKELENLVRELREGELTREKTVQVKRWITDFEQTVQEEYESLQASREITGRSVREVEARLAAEEAAAGAGGADSGRSGGGRSAGAGGKANRSAGSGKSDRTADAEISLVAGVEVYIGKKKQRAVLIRPAKKGFWVVEAGALRLTVAETDILPIPRSALTQRAPVIEVQTEMGGNDTPAWELRLLGMRHDEAMKALERQLDLAVMKGLKEFSIVHGKGSGVLQVAVHQMLGTTACVSEYSFALPENGGTGKTIVKLS